MQKTLIYQDKNTYEKNKSAWEKEKDSLQKVVGLYDNTNLPKLTGDDMHRMLNDAPNFMYDKLTGGEAAHLTIGNGESKTHLPVIKSKAIDILQKPAGYNELMAGIDEIKKSSSAGAVSNGDVIWRLGDVLKYFVLDETGTVQFSEIKSAEIEDAGKSYIYSDKANAVYNFMQSAVNVFYDNGLHEIYPNSRQNNGICNIFMDFADSLKDGDKSLTMNLSICHKDNEWRKIEEHKKN